MTEITASSRDRRVRRLAVSWPLVNQMLRLGFPATVPTEAFPDARVLQVIPDCNGGIVDPSGSRRQLVTLLIESARFAPVPDGTPWERVPEWTPTFRKVDAALSGELMEDLLREHQAARELFRLLGEQLDEGRAPPFPPRVTEKLRELRSAVGFVDHLLVRNPPAGEARTSA